MNPIFKFIAALCFISVVSPAHAEKINIFAAASMQTALTKAATVWQAKTGNEIVATFGSSATLAKQIEQGAPADIFISADLAWMDELAAKNLIKADTRKNIAGNTLVVVAAKGTSTKLDLADKTNLAAVLGQDKLALGDIKSVPAGKYAKAALDKLGLWASIEKNVVMQDNVRAALALVARGEAKLGIVYGSDVVAEPKVETVATFAEESHPKIVYPAAVIATSKNPDAEKFIAFLTAIEGQLILRENGFTTAP